MLLDLHCLRDNAFQGALAAKLGLPVCSALAGGLCLPLDIHLALPRDGPGQLALPVCQSLAGRRLACCSQLLLCHLALLCCLNCTNRHVSEAPGSKALALQRRHPCEEHGGDLNVGIDRKLVGCVCNRAQIEFSAERQSKIAIAESDDDKDKLLAATGSYHVRKFSLKRCESSSFVTLYLETCRS